MPPLSLPLLTNMSFDDFADLGDFNYDEFEYDGGGGVSDDGSEFSYDGGYAYGEKNKNFSFFFGADRVNVQS